LDGIVSAGLVRRQLNLTQSKTDHVIAALRRMGFLEPIRSGRSLKPTENERQLSKNAIRLRGATAAKPLRRETAEYLLSQVQKAVVFGSYIGEMDRIGDLDIAVQLVRREPDFEKHTQANNRRVAEQFARGRSISNIVDQAFWWQREAMLFLRRRSRGLSLHNYGAIREIVHASPHRVVFQESASRPVARQPLVRPGQIKRFRRCSQDQAGRRRTAPLVDAPNENVIRRHEGRAVVGCSDFGDDPMNTERRPVLLLLLLVSISIPAAPAQGGAAVVG
jgi:hypothetical protein